TPAKAVEDTKPTAAVPAPPPACVRYCVESVPCGDTCVGADDSCASPPGTACAADKRPQPKFRQGDPARNGLVSVDVAAYNKAQGDPIDGLFDLAQAFAGDAALADAANGTLHATIKTTMGNLECELFEKQAPYTVANFVGLARGTRPSRDRKTNEWKNIPFYDGVIFHRVIENFMLQTGDRDGTGRGNPGYFVPDEFDKTLRHNRPGILSMANRNRVDPRTQKLRTDPKTGLPLGNTGSSQFFVTVAPTAYLDDRHSIFGRCDTKVATKISKVQTQTNRALGMDHRPKKDVKIKSISFERRK
ncbi:MAG: peptidylprolyl isomerase, partial [Nannocystaceae bacterium]